VQYTEKGRKGRRSSASVTQVGENIKLVRWTNEIAGYTERQGWKEQRMKDLQVNFLFYIPVQTSSGAHPTSSSMGRPTGALSGAYIARVWC
jgi:hypothetical protein